MNAESDRDRHDLSSVEEFDRVEALTHALLRRDYDWAERLRTDPYAKPTEPNGGKS